MKGGETGWQSLSGRIGVAKKGKQGMSINATPQARGSLER